MIIPQKKFSEKDYEKNSIAFESLKKEFAFLYPVLRMEDYGVDVAIYNGKRAFEKKVEPLCYLEIESKSNWKSYEFPSNFPDVQFLAKKQKFINMDKTVYWVLFNDDCSNAGIINFKNIVTCELDVVNCKNGIGDDFFYRIPKKDMMWGLSNIERFLIHDAFKALNHFHSYNTLK